MLGTGSFVAGWIDGIEGNQGSGQFQGVGDISRRQLIHLYEGTPAGHAGKKPIMADPKKPKKSCKPRLIRDCTRTVAFAFTMLHATIIMRYILCELGS